MFFFFFFFAVTFFFFFLIFVLTWFLRFADRKTSSISSVYLKYLVVRGSLYLKRELLSEFPIGRPISINRIYYQIWNKSCYLCLQMLIKVFIGNDELNLIFK